MRKNRKFAKNARRQKTMAFILTLVVFSFIFAAMSKGENWARVLPDFLKEIIGTAAEAAPQA